MVLPLITHCSVKAGLEGKAADLGRSAATFNQQPLPSAAVLWEHRVDGSKTSCEAQVLWVSWTVLRTARPASFMLSGQGTPSRALRPHPVPTLALGELLLDRPQHR